MSCDNCLKLTSGSLIKLPIDLKRAIQKAAEAVKSGVFKYEGAGCSGDPFESLARGDHWSDFVSNYFSCKMCGQLFHLHAETYHGAGGAFEKIEKIDERLQNDTFDT
jgi:hypothetical protein